MNYNINLANQVREALVHLADVEEKEMFSGICFMVNGKMCICVSGTEMLCRIGAAQMENALENYYCRQMIINGRPSRDFIFVGEDGFTKKSDLDYWIKLALDFNPIAKSSKKKTKSTSSKKG